MSGAVERSGILSLNKDLDEGAGQITVLSEKEKLRTRPHHHLMRGQVYFIRDGDTIKIGWSRNPEERVVTLQNQQAGYLELLTAAPGTQRHERTLHERFGHLRLHGEWFRAGPELLDFIEHVRKTGRTFVTKSDEERRVRVQMLALEARYKDKVPVVSRVRIYLAQMSNAKKSADPDHAAALRKAALSTAESLAQVIRDGGEYIHQNHFRVPPP